MIRKRYSNDFRDQAIELVALGRPVPEVAEELGISTTVLYRWTQSQRGAGGASASTQLGGVVQRAGGELDEAAELRRLRKENNRLLMENDILKKAAVILGTLPQPQAKPAR
ncbi:transposase [Brevifollis gellanilyticus]|uniref:transposase n=1 Tax=Brevifollis gellanilyticus TaxID=748831 RepID=UPI0014795D05|nr:transposase [Brevifollis gellanilyticus]